MTASSFIGIGAATLDALSIVSEFRADEYVTQVLTLVEDDSGPVARCAEHASHLAMRNVAGLGGRHALNLEV